MTRLRWLLQSRGVDAQYVLLLLASVAVAWLATEVTVELRSPADQLIRGAVLDSGVVVGLVIPVAILGRALQNRLAWMAESSPRSTVHERVLVIAMLLVAAGAVSVAIVSLAPHQVATGLVLWDFFLLLGLAIIGAVLLGAGQAWAVPAVVALVASTRGVVPIGWNVLANSEVQQATAVITVVTLGVAVSAYVVLDDYGLARRSRLLERLPGVTDE